MKEQNLITNTLILTVTSFLTRTIGMISSVFLSQMLGAEGIGIYELLMTIYMTAVVFSSAGLCVSVSRLVAEALGKNESGNITQIMRVAFSFGFIMSILVSILLFTSAPLLVNYLIHDSSAIFGLRFLTLSIPFMTCSSCFKGYFYATKKAAYPASADILEQIIKVGLLMVLVNLYAPKGPAYAYSMIGIGFTVGEIVSWSYLLSLFILDRRHIKKHTPPTHSMRHIFIKLLTILLPIASISYIGYLFLSVENILIPAGLKKYSGTFSSSIGTLGILKGMVFPILFFPSAFLTAFSTTLIPEIAKANVLKHKKRVAYTTNRVLQLTFILSILVVAIFVSYGNELGFIIYKTEEVGPLLCALSLVVPFIYTEVISDGILKGLNEQVSCLKYSMLDSITRVILIYFFLPIKGVKALITIIMMSCILTSTLNFNKLMEVTQIKMHPINWLLKPAVAAAFSGSYSRLIINKLFRYSLGLNSKVFLGIGLTIFLYIPLLFLIQTLTQEDVLWIKKHLSRPKLQKYTSKT